MRIAPGQLPLGGYSCTCVICPIHQNPTAQPSEATERVYFAVLDGRLEIDQDGRVWRASERAERPKGLYLRVRTRVNGKLYSTHAHRLVWRHFSGHPIPAGLQVNHINGDGFDNSPDNLELVTPREQGLHRHNYLRLGRFTPEARAKGNQVQQAMSGKPRNSHGQGTFLARPE